jgi:hypothetical protein
MGCELLLPLHARGRPPVLVGARLLLLLLQHHVDMGLLMLVLLLVLVVLRPHDGG